MFFHHEEKGFVTVVIAFVIISFTVGYHVKVEKSTECPEYWVKIGTGCYLFAIPEILEIDGSCRLDGNYSYWNFKIYRILI